MVRGGIEQSQLSDLTSLLVNFSCLEYRDRWWWSLDPQGLFSVKSTRCWIDKVVLPSSLAPTRWNKLTPRKVNILKLESLRNKCFIGGDTGEKKMTWVKWDRCLASKKEGGLGIGIFMVSNEVLTLPLIEVLNAAHVPLSLLRSIASKQKIGNGIDSSFWNELWCGNHSLKEMFPRIYNLETDKRCFIASRIGLQYWALVLRHNPRGGEESGQFNALKNVIGNISLTDHRDCWQWSLGGSVGFTVASIRSLVDSHSLDIDLWSLLAKWWELDIPVCGNITEWYDWLGGVHVSSKARSQVRVLSRAIGVSSHVRKGNGVIAFWAGPNLVVWDRYAFWARGYVATIAVKKSKG
ncbi:hypothetical protein Tco_1289660 [Tanacetum coccineum]